MPSTQPNAARRYARLTSDPRRLAAVRATGLPEGRGPRDRFEQLAAVAARLLDAPVAIISLVDAERDVWVGLTGVPPTLAAAGGTTMRPSFCQAIIASTRSALAIRDARTSSVFAEFPSVRALGVGACLGVPLITRNGHALGTCCVYDMKPRDWTPQDIETLSAFGVGAVAEMERLAALSTGDEISDAVVRYLAAAVARHFSALAGPLPTGGSVDLAVTAHDIWRLLQIVAGEEASVTLDFADGMSPVAVDHARMVRLLVTLVTGARQALNGRGWIQIAGESGDMNTVRMTIRAVNANAPLGVPLARSAIVAADQLLGVCGGQVATHDDTRAVALLRTAERGGDRLE